MKINMVTTIIICTLYSFTAKAQINKGSWMIGGQATFNSRTGKADLNDYSSRQKNTAGAFEIATGYTFRENQVLGILASYSSIKSRFSDQNISSTQSKSKRKGIGAFYRIYHPLGNKFNVFGQAAALYNNSQMDSGPTHQISHEGNFTVSPGISYEVLRNVQLEVMIPNIISLDYVNARQNIDGHSSSPAKKSFSANTSFASGALANLGIGFKIFI